MCGHVDGAKCTLEAMRVTAEMVVAFLQAVEADGERAEPGIQQLGVAFGRHRKSVRDHAPRVAALHDFLAAFLEVGAHQRFTAGNHHNEVLRVDMRSEFVQHVHEVFTGHVRDGVLDAVATAMQAVQVAAEQSR